MVNAGLDKQVAVVTGAGGGMGRGICAALLEQDARVVLTDLTQEAVDGARADLDPGGSRTAGIPADVCDGEALDRVVSAALEAFGRLDCWVNNAGIVELGPVLDTAPHATAREFDVNFHAVLQGCRAVARHMVARGGGKIVNVASNAGKVGFPNMVGYNASKAAVINLTRGLAQEWAAHGINVNAVCPGSVSTPMLERVADVVAGDTGAGRQEVLKAMRAEQLGRLIEPIEVGRVVAFLLSDQALVIRGQSINVDAGATPY